MSSVYTNTQANSIYNTYSINNRSSNHFMQRLSTGLKIMTPKDNASVYAISERMRSQIRANDQANQNAQNDASLLKVAQGGISNTVDILKTLKERAINAANDSNLNQNRSDIATEVQQLGLQIDDNAYKVKYNNRAVLNGGYDTTVGRLNGSSAVNANTDAATVKNPANYATHAVYNMTGLQTLSGATLADVTADSAKVVDLSDEAKKSIFHSGDKITLSWKEDGALVKKEVTLSKTTTLADLATGFTSGNLTFSFEGTTTDKLESGDSGTYDKKVLGASDFEELTVQAAGGIGLYAVGNKDVSITDFSISVTSTNPNDGKTITNTDAQEYLAEKLNGVQQSFGATDEGSNTVFTSKLYVGENAKGIAYGSGNATKLSDLALKGGSTPIFGANVVEVGININGDGEFKVDASSTIDDLNTELAKRGYNVRAYLLQAGDEVMYEGSAVTRGTGENQSTLKATANALYFVGEGDTKISSITIGGYDATETAANFTANSLADTSGATASLTKLQSYGTGKDNTTTSNTNPLTFFIGGEPNFGMEVTINKMDIKSLLGMDADSFAKKFLTKEGAESALTMIDEALNKALNEQTKLGAIENRLGYASDNLTTMNTNTEESDSVLRDADIAKDMVQYAKYSVLSQIAQAMLAQANNAASGALSFLQQ